MTTSDPRFLDQIQADHKKAVDAKHQLLDCAFVVSLSVAIIGLAVLIAMSQALASADRQIHKQDLKNQENVRHG